MGTVINRFWCRIEKRTYEAGEEYNGNRLVELVEKGYVEATEKAKHTKRKTKDDE